MTWATLAIAALLTAHAPVPFEVEIDSALGETADIYPVPKALVLAVISVESGFRPSAVSRAGAKGLMQLMPYTARRVGVAETELLDPQRNILGGVRLLAVLLRHYEGDLVSALVAYNARPRRLRAPVPRNGETPGYVWKVLATFKRLSSPASRSDEPRPAPSIAVLSDQRALVLAADAAIRDEHLAAGRPARASHAGELLGAGCTRSSRAAARATPKARRARAGAQLPFTCSARYWGTPTCRMRFSCASSQ